MTDGRDCAVCCASATQETGRKIGRNLTRIGGYGAVRCIAAPGNIVKDSLLGRVILVVEDEPLIALDVRTVLEAAGAMVVHATARHAAQAADNQQSLSAAILDLRPGSSDHRPIARRLKDRGIPFLFYSTHPPEDVTTVRGAPVVLKPGRPDEIVMAVALLLRAGRA
jgi:CheY-like chemotaxis protein